MEHTKHIISPDDIINKHGNLIVVYKIYTQQKYACDGCNKPLESGCSHTIYFYDGDILAHRVNHCYECCRNYYTMIYSLDYDLPLILNITSGDYSSIIYSVLNGTNKLTKSLPELKYGEIMLNLSEKGGEFTSMIFIEVNRNRIYLTGDAAIRIVCCDNDSDDYVNLRAENGRSLRKPICEKCYPCDLREMLSLRFARNVILAICEM